MPGTRSPWLHTSGVSATGRSSWTPGSTRTSCGGSLVSRRRCTDHSKRSATSLHTCIHRPKKRSSVYTSASNLVRSMPRDLLPNIAGMERSSVHKLNFREAGRRGQRTGVSYCCTPEWRSHSYYLAPRSQSPAVYLRRSVSRRRPFPGSCGQNISSVALEGTGRLVSYTVSSTFTR